MAHVKLSDVNVRIPIYDKNALRLFKRGGARVRGSVGAGDFVTSGVLQVHALADICLELFDNDRVALIGHNGAGKTTLLRTIAGIYPIVSGVRAIDGTVYFYGGNSTMNADASGYENIRLAMQLNKVPMHRYAHFKQDIEEFTELGEYLNLPTRIYSSGMMARLSFAIGTMHSPDILLIDEAIGVGDAQFTDKVEARIKRFTERARIMVFASHADALLRKMCNKGAVFDGGKIIFYGELEAALAMYGKTALEKKVIEAA